MLCAALAGLSCLLTVVPVVGFQPNVPVAFVTPLEATAMAHSPAVVAAAESSSECTPLSPQLQQSAASKNLPPVIQQIADNRAEFQLNLGRAMDTLRRDMPEILTKTPGRLLLNYCWLASLRLFDTPHHRSSSVIDSQ